ncbi:MAG: insulinase family protein [Deltaproteobacteria bacterium]|nr:insulinase family protein [Deltaproteobacteria bacterium]
MALVSTVGAGSSAVAAPSAYFPYPVRVERLENGFTVALVPFPSKGLVAYYTLVRVGSRNEVEVGHTGFAHLFEHMMFRGTKKVSADKRDELTKTRGIDDTAWTYIDHTVYTLQGPSASLPTMIEIEADRFQNLWYAKDIFQTETKAVLGEYNKNFSNPANKMDEVLSETIFKRHTYKHTTMGYLDDIKRMPEMYEYGQGFFKRFYRPDACTLFVVGDFDAEKTLALIKLAYGGWGDKVERPKVVAEAEQDGERVKHVDWDKETKPRMFVAFRSAAMNGDFKDAAIQNLLFPLLFGPATPLYKDLVLDRQLVESIESWYIDTIDPRFFPVLFTLKDASKFDEVKRTVFAAIERAATGDGVSPKFFADVQSNARYGLLMGLTSPAKVAEKLVWAATPTGDPAALGPLYERIAGLTLADVKAYLAKHWVARNRTVVTLSTKAKK